MGREATCICEWNDAKAEVKAQIEPPDLILRGAIRRRIRIAEMKDVRVEGECLFFLFARDRIALHLGPTLAVKWAAALLQSPPTLAKKLGITPETTVHRIGLVDEDALKEALAVARKVSTRAGELVIASVGSPEALSAALFDAADELRRGVPIWLIYRKGPGHALNEALVRSTALAAGIVDTKVVSVSSMLTGLRFVKRKS